MYRWRLKPDAEAQFASDWRTVTHAASRSGDALGSALFKADDGTWAAIAKWPSREARESFFARAVFPPELLARQQAAVLERFPPLELDLVDNQWSPEPA